MLRPASRLTTFFTRINTFGSSNLVAFRRDADVCRTAALAARQSSCTSGYGPSSCSDLPLIPAVRSTLFVAVAAKTLLHLQETLGDAPGGRPVRAV
jgi:hypothetical protein